MSHHTRGRKAQADPVSEPIIDVPDPPAEFGEASAAEWRQIMPVLVQRRVLSAADMSAVAFYAQAVGDAVEARAALQRDGQYLPNARGELKRHPAFTTLKEANGEARRWAAELGLTPASRSRVGGAEGDENDASAAMDL